MAGRLGCFSTSWVWSINGYSESCAYVLGCLLISSTVSKSQASLTSEHVVQPEEVTTLHQIK